MTTHYKGFKIEVKREKCRGGWSMIYYTVIRESDGWFLEDSFCDTADTVRTMTQAMKYRIDDYLEHPKEYEDWYPGEG